MSSWEWQAERWLRWARTPGHDAYWHYREGFFAEIVPEPGRRTLEVGCGEGRVARDLGHRGHRMVAVDASPTLVGHAADANPDGRYLVADAAALPFRDGSFDAVVAYNSLMDVDDMPAAVAEAARVLDTGGRLCVCVTHPTADAGRFAGDEPAAPFTIPGAYLGRHRLEEDTFERDGLEITFTGWRYALEEYAGALEAAGLLVERLREPAAPPAAVALRPSYRRWQRLPMFLHLRAVKR
ncbi:MAG TPA: class I SAM-dependent methyltransferase [Actinomycetota bacterium]|nr:class I SAM-dependent methyltransferase [Actinomycetota bacterium]